MLDNSQNIVCQFCGKQMKNKIQQAAHERFCKKNPKYAENLKHHIETVTKYGAAINHKKLRISVKHHFDCWFICSKCGKFFKKTFTYNEFLKFKKNHKQNLDKVFCCHKCANSHIISNKQKYKISLSLTNKKIKYKICKHCGKLFISNSKKKYCSKICQKLDLFDIRSKNSKKIYENLVAKFRFKGWTTRNIASYPERFFKKVLYNNNISYEFNKPINKRNLGFNDSCNYFLDFYLSKNIDLEIDGKQHQYLDRKKSDSIRDAALIKYGFKVYRIEWNEINSQAGKKLMKKKISDFIVWYNNL